MANVQPAAAQRGRTCAARLAASGGREAAEEGPEPARMTVASQDQARPQNQTRTCGFASRFFGQCASLLAVATNSDVPITVARSGLEWRLPVDLPQCSSTTRPADSGVGAPRPSLARGSTKSLMPRRREVLVRDNVMSFHGTLYRCRARTPSMILDSAFRVPLHGFDSPIVVDSPCSLSRGGKFMWSLLVLLLVGLLAGWA
jgi:hypothetical protein